MTDTWKAPHRGADGTDTARRWMKTGDTGGVTYTARMTALSAPAPAPFLSIRAMATAQAQAETFGADDIVLSLGGRGEMMPQLVAMERVIIRMPDPHAQGLPDKQGMRRAALHIVQTLHGYAFSGRHIVVHCPAGLSRSRSVATALGEAWGVPVRYEGRWSISSRLVDEAMRAVLAEHPLRDMTPAPPAHP